MASGDLASLRDALEFLPSQISGSTTHSRLAGSCIALGLPTPPDEGTKFERAAASFKALPDAILPLVAARVLTTDQLEADQRNTVQDAMWAIQDQPEIPTRTRRELARDLDLDLDPLVRYAERFTRLLDSLWVLDDDPLDPIFGRQTLRTHISEHVFRNSDWSAEELFERLQAFEASDKRFALFLEGLTSEVIPDVEVRRQIVAAINPHLGRVGVELRETGDNGGYPVFGLVSTRSSRGRPKNLIFASTSKPDIRFIDAIDNDIEIVGNPDSVLVYDRPIGADGLRWRELQTWWKESGCLKTDEEAKRTLYSRLQSCLPDSSPPQRNLYREFHSIFSSDVPSLPALLPEVWLHWDPKTVRARGRDALLRFRMDFLLLLPHGRRVVLEVDGKHHYAVNDRADPVLYANNMRADRDLKLSDYEVFRFGADELRTTERAHATVQYFFQDLFRSYGVIPS